MAKNLCILLAEDDENDVYFFQRAAQEAELDQRISVAVDGQQAIDYLSGRHPFADRSRYPLPFLLLLDLKMPRRTGMEVLQWVRSQDCFKVLPVIVFSSSAEPEDVHRAYQLGANAYVVKPPSSDDRIELLTLIRQFWVELNLVAPYPRGTPPASGAS